MEYYQEAMVKSLVAVAWADGRVDEEESEVIEALIDAFHIEGPDAESIREYAKTQRSIEDVPLTELGAHDRRMLLQHAVILTYVDGEQSEEEREVLRTLVQKLNLEEGEAKELLDAADERAKRLLEHL
ncbi:MAG: TerB family tellurite resistance protein [Myxococcales bacterium]|nr:TerB family tellurite resistance protein [Myxococcales bacterium]